MRRLLATVPLLCLGLAGCGQESTAQINLPATESPAQQGEVGDPEKVVLLHATAAGGTVGDPVPVGTDEQLRAFTDQLTSDAFVGEVRRAVAAARSAAGEGEVVEAAVVSLGCDVPEAVTRGDDGTLTVSTPKAGTQRQCLAPMTTVAVLTVAG